jgi:hypothetical protein
MYHMLRRDHEQCNEYRETEQDAAAACNRAANSGTIRENARALIYRRGGSRESSFADTRERGNRKLKNRRRSLVSIAHLVSAIQPAMAIAPRLNRMSL